MLRSCNILRWGRHGLEQDSTHTSHKQGSIKELRIWMARQHLAQCQQQRPFLNCGIAIFYFILWSLLYSLNSFTQVSCISKNSKATLQNKSEGDERRWQRRTILSSPPPTDTQRPQVYLLQLTQKTIRRDLPQLIIERKTHWKGKRGGDMARNQTPGAYNHEQESHHKHGGLRGSDPTQGNPGPKDLHWEDKFP